MDKELEFFRNNLTYLFQASIIFKWLRDHSDELEPPVDKILISGVGRTYLQGLAALFDPLEMSGNKNLSTKLIGEFNIGLHEAAVIKIKKLRDKLISHNDSTSYDNPDKFVREVNLTIEETDALIEFLVDTIEKARGEKMPKDEFRKSTIRALKQTFHIE